MTAVFLAGLLAVVTDVTGALEHIAYTPRLTERPLEAKITASTFVLEQPRCEFNSRVSETDGIWLVVALGDAMSNFSSPASAQDLPPYRLFPEKNPYYMTLKTSWLNYPCPKTSEDITVLRVGNETGCLDDASKPDCNGPLPLPGPYRVKFLAMNDTGPTAETLWSEPITLIQGKSPDTIDTAPRRRSAGMIVIASILSILLAILLAALIAALVYKYTDVCGSADITSMKGSATVARYVTHHIYDQPAHRS